MSSASWVTLSNLGTYDATHNFNLNTIVINFTADANAKIIVLNGALPSGIRWVREDNTIIITGESTVYDRTLTGAITWRIADPDGTVADRTYSITITPMIVYPSWAGQPQFLGYATIGMGTTFTLIANIASKEPISYRLLNAPAGMSVDPLTGIITYLPPMSLITPTTITPMKKNFYFGARVKTDDNRFEDLAVYVTALSADSPPVWITASGKISDVIAKNYVELQIQAYDPAIGNGNATSQIPVTNFTGNHSNWTIDQSAGTISLSSIGLPYHSYGNPQASIESAARVIDVTMPYRGGSNVAGISNTVTNIDIVGYALNGVVLSNPSSHGTAPDGYPPAPTGYTYNAAYSDVASAGYTFDDDLAGGNAWLASKDNGGTYNYHSIFFSSAWLTGIGDVLGSVGIADTKALPYYNGTLTHTDGHSKILGFALDGYPIYGPIGYTNQLSNLSGVAPLVSGYTLLNSSSRAPNASNTTTWPMGMFLEDYSFTGGGDLDVHNGRFCVTPDYPLGTYAYFCTSNNTNTVPVFPYIVGSSFYGDVTGVGTGILPVTYVPSAFTQPSIIPTLRYMVTASSDNFPFILTPSGFLYGIVPDVANDTKFTFTVTAIGTNGSIDQTFYISVFTDLVNGSLLWQTENIDLGIFPDGQQVDIDVSAKSTRAQHWVTHRFVGGSLPPTITLNMSQGRIAGFLDYHAQNRKYTFDISATDGIQTIIHRYSMTVIRDTKDQFTSVSIPISGTLKDALYIYKQDVLSGMYNSPHSNALQDRVSDEMLLIDGLKYQPEGPDNILKVANLQITSTNVIFDSISNVAIDTAGNQLLYLNVVDKLADSDRSFVTAGQNTIYPATLNNMRKELIDTVGFANSGRGSGVSIVSRVLPDTTEISAVTVVNPGQGFYVAPELKASPPGSGAVFNATITVNSVDILSSTQGWIADEVINYRVNETQVIKLKVSQTSNVGELLVLDVLDGGAFDIFPQQSKTLISVTGATAIVTFDLCINDVTIVSRGKNYKDFTTYVASSGTEAVPEYLSAYIPHIPIATIFGGFTPTAIQNSKNSNSVLSTFVWHIDQLVVNVQGKSWDGTAMFDDNICVFDGGQTRFTEWSEPCNTIFDYDTMFIDSSNTRFNDNPDIVHYSYRVWGETIFDTEQTVTDMYNTVFDEAAPTNSSITRIRKIYHLLSQQISGNNFVE